MFYLLTIGTFKACLSLAWYGCPCLARVNNFHPLTNAYNVWRKASTFLCTNIIWICMSYLDFGSSMYYPQQIDIDYLWSFVWSCAYSSSSDIASLTFTFDRFAIINSEQFRLCAPRSSRRQTKALDEYDLSLGEDMPFDRMNGLGDPWWQIWFIFLHRTFCSSSPPPARPLCARLRLGGVYWLDI